jgi:hypothetical protein
MPVVPRSSRGIAAGLLRSASCPFQIEHDMDTILRLENVCSKSLLALSLDPDQWLRFFKEKRSDISEQ